MLQIEGQKITITIKTKLWKSHYCRIYAVGLQRKNIAREISHICLKLFALYYVLSEARKVKHIAINMIFRDE